MKVDVNFLHDYRYLRSLYCLNVGDIIHLNDDLLPHKEDGPAIIKKDVEEWYKHGKRHRVEGPAFIRKYNMGFNAMWYKNGNLHREDGPASENFSLRLTNDINGHGYPLRFAINGRDITMTVMNWIKENDLPQWRNWDDHHKILFKLTFGDFI